MPQPLAAARPAPAVFLDSPAGPAGASRGPVVAALAGMAGAWIAAGSLGFVSQPLRNGLLWLALGAIMIGAWPKGRLPWPQWAMLAIAVLTALALAVPIAPELGVLGIALVVAVAARLHPRPDRQVLLLVSLAAIVLAIFRLITVSIPAVWFIANSIGHGLGQFVAIVSGKPLDIGATYAGLELLMPMMVLYVGWLFWTAPPRRARALYGAAAIAVIHLGYLLLLAWATDLELAIPVPSPPTQNPYVEFYNPPDWHWSQAVLAMLPWNLPVMAGLLYLVLLGLMFCRTPWLPGAPRQTPNVGGAENRGRLPIEYAPPLLALLLPIAVVLAPTEQGLDHRKIVAYNQGALDWAAPVHDAYGQHSAGMYGMLPRFVEALGGKLVRSDELTAQDLHDADVLLLLHPNEDWPQDRLERVWQYVRDGGSLLLVTGPAEENHQPAAGANRVLEPCAMRIRLDAALSPTLYWQQALDIPAHPATAGIDDRRNRFGFQLGSSIRVAWPARPLLVGRHGWSDPDPSDALNSDYRFHGGEPLGDLVLAAEQLLDRGTVVVLADPYRMTNEGNVNAFPFTGRLLSYLAQRLPNPQSGWRQAAGILLSVLLIGLMLVRHDPSQVALVAVALGISLVAAQSANGGPGSVVPDGGNLTPNPVAYIDASHLEAYSEENWRFDDVAGLKLTLMRNGYLPLMAPDLSRQRLQRASLLISIAPARAFSKAERTAIREFVEGGGIFISMVGAQEAGPSRALLDDFGFRIPPSTLLPAIGQQPQHLRNFRSRYLDARTTGRHDCYVRFNAAWPIECSAPNALFQVRDFDNRPVLGVCRVGAGKVVVIGDTGFAMNKNLEYVGGEPFDGDYENAHFWRWFFTYLNNQPMWIPPEPAPDDPAETLGPGSGNLGGAAPQAEHPQRAEESP